jgi:hypothetical protein
MLSSPFGYINTGVVVWFLAHFLLRKGIAPPFHYSRTSVFLAHFATPNKGLAMFLNATTRVKKTTEVRLPQFLSSIKHHQLFVWLQKCGWNQQHHKPTVTEYEK